MAYSQLRAASLPLPTRSPLFARRSMSDPIVLSTEELPPPEDLQRLFVPIVSIDHLSQHYQDLPVDDILALGDQALLYQFEQAFCQNQTTERRSQPTMPQSGGSLQLALSAKPGMAPSPGSLPSNPSQPSYQLGLSKEDNWTVQVQRISRNPTAVRDAMYDCHIENTSSLSTDEKNESSKGRTTKKRGESSPRKWMLDNNDIDMTPSP